MALSHFSLLNTHFSLLKICKCGSLYIF